MAGLHPRLALTLVAQAMRGLVAAVILVVLVFALPWALWRYVGWPLPDHIPTWVEVEAVLLGPMTATFLLDLLACVAWLAWAWFVADVLRFAGQAVRDGLHDVQWRQVSRGGPVHALAAVLIGTVLVSIASNRVAHSQPGAVELSSFVEQVEPRPAPTAIVRPHDSLSLISERTFGTQMRWPEIFELNKGQVQPNGRPFTNPDLVFPGEVLRLPADTLPPVAQPEELPTPPEPPDPPPTTASPAVEVPPASANAEPAISWGTEFYAGLGLAAAVSSALAVARRRHRRRYQPGSGRRDDLDIPVAPVVYRLQLAHLRAEQRDEAEPDDDATDLPPPTSAKLGTRDGREVALDLAAARGLGLVGPGATAAARALLVTALTTNHPAMSAGTRLLVPADDLPLLLGSGVDRTHMPASVLIVANLDEALNALETDVHDERQDPRQATMLIARASEPDHERLSRVLANGTSSGVVGVLLGQWQTGVTAYVRADGTISATSPGAGEALRGTKVFRVEAEDALALLDLLHRAQPDSPPASANAHAASPHIADLEIVDRHPTAQEQPSARPAAAADAVADEPDHLDARIHLTVLGRPQVFWCPQHGSKVEITSAFQPRLRELLTFLGLHPDGATRESLINALWIDSPTARTTSALNTALSRLRSALAKATAGNVSDFLLTENGNFGLDPSIVDVDYWRFDRAVTRRRFAKTLQERVGANRDIVNHYAGPLADGMSADWLESTREAVRRDALDAVSDLARALVDDAPEETLELLEIARAFDPHNELLYRDIMRLQERLGRLDAIPRTLALLTRRLTEVDDAPTPQAIELAARLQRRHDTAPKAAS